MKVQMSSNPRIRKFITTKNGAFEIEKGFKSELENQRNGIFTGKPVALKDKTNKGNYENN